MGEPKRAPSVVDAIRERLARAIVTPFCELRYESPWQLLVATILSAQATDERVNRVTPALFARWPTPEALAEAPQPEVEEVIRSTGFYRNKAKSIRGASKRIVARHGGEVPQDLDALTALPGVARKTANLVLGTAFGLRTGMVVDTHVTRVAQRLALTQETKPEKIEPELCALFPKAEWTDASHRLLLHGRYVCTAKRPDCVACPLAEICPAAEATPSGAWTERADAEWERIRAHQP
jgi:endonuclease-3